MIEFSAKLKEKGLPTEVRSERDVDALMEAFRADLKARNLWQYYVLDVKSERQRVKEAVEHGQVKPWSGAHVTHKSHVEVAQILKDSGNIQGLGGLGKRLGTTVDPAVAAGLVKAAFPDIQHNADALAEAWTRIIDVLNVPLYQEWEEDTKIALDNIKNRLKYARLDPHGPRKGPISKRYVIDPYDNVHSPNPLFSNPLMESYFTRVKGPANADPALYSLANNGWIWNADPLANFALPPSKAYLRREVIVWGDCVKLRYGDGPSSNPWLWEHMTKYVTSLASSFEGFRIDNCHSTPLHVGVALLDAARVVNPDLYICAELFTGSKEMDTLFVSRLGINSLIREAGNAWEPKELSRLLYSFGLGKPVGKSALLRLVEVQY